MIMHNCNSKLGTTPSTVLPTEVIARVFECCLPTTSERLGTSLQLLAPLTLTWVCRSWRELALSIPTLWTDLVIGHRRTDPAEDVKVMEMWLDRSGELPVELRLSYELSDVLHPVLFDHEREKRYWDGMKKVLGIAVRCIDRWTTFEIHTLDVSVLDQVFLALVTRGAPYLEALVFSTKYLGFFGDMHVLDFSLCPKLRNVCLRTPMITPVIGSGVMENMRSLELRFCASVEDCLRWVDVCPALEELSVRLFSSSSTTPDSPVGELNDEMRREIRRGLEPPLRRLDRLKSHNFSVEDDVGPLLDLMDLPALKRLRVNMYEMVSTPPPPSSLRSRLGEGERWGHLLSLLHRSSPPLEKFEVLGTPMSVRDITSCLRLLPSLKHLAIGMSRNTDMDELLEALTENTIDSVCPKLEILDLTNCPVCIDCLARLVSSRCRNIRHNPEMSKSETETKSEVGVGGVKALKLKEIRLDVKTASSALQNLTIFECTKKGDGEGGEGGLRVVGREEDRLVTAFANSDVVFV